MGYWLTGEVFGEKSLQKDSGFVKLCKVLGIERNTFNAYDTLVSE